MRNTLRLLGVVAFALVATIVFAAPPDTMVIDKAADKKPGAPFPHAQHVEAVDTCVECHHTSEGLTLQSAGDVEKCSDCHFEPEGDVPDMAQMSMKKNPFHMSCMGCHKEVEQGPTKCNDCHTE